jgi:hypothetical protein
MWSVTFRAGHSGHVDLPALVGELSQVSADYRHLDSRERSTSSVGDQSSDDGRFVYGDCCLSRGGMTRYGETSDAHSNEDATTKARA